MERLRWRGFGHSKRMSGSMNDWLAAAPAARLAYGMVGCRVSIDDVGDREARVLADREVIDVGRRAFPMF